jgi:hypothetical protein
MTVTTSHGLLVASTVAPFICAALRQLGRRRAPPSPESRMRSKYTYLLKDPHHPRAICAKTNQPPDRQR